MWSKLLQLLKSIVLCHKTEIISLFKELVQLIINSIKNKKQKK